MKRVPGALPANSRTLASVPTFTITPRRMAMAWATESLASTVRMWPRIRTRSAAGFCAGSIGVNSRVPSRTFDALSLRYRDIVQFYARPRLFLIDRRASCDRAHNLQIFDCLLVHGVRIVCQHDEVRQLSRCDGSFDRFLM